MGTSQTLRSAQVETRTATEMFCDGRGPGSSAGLLAAADTEESLGRREHSDWGPGRVSRVETTHDPGLRQERRDITHIKLRN